MYVYVCIIHSIIIIPTIVMEAYGNIGAHKITWKMDLQRRWLFGIFVSLFIACHTVNVVDIFPPNHVGQDGNGGVGTIRSNTRGCLNCWKLTDS